MNLLPNHLDFGTQGVGTVSPPKTVTLTNVGTTALAITSISIAGADFGDFSQSNNCGTAVGAGKSCTITVRFIPTATGPRIAALSLADNGGGSPQRVALSGTGT